jgi:hypothetical protein
MRSTISTRKKESASSKLYKSKLGNIYDESCSLCHTQVSSWNTDKRLKTEKKCGVCKDERIDFKTTLIESELLQIQGTCDFCQRYFCLYHQDPDDEKGRCTGMCKRCHGFHSYIGRKPKEISDLWAKARACHLQVHQEIDTVKNCLQPRWG